MGGRRAYRYRSLDEHGRVVDVLPRAHRDLDSARAGFLLATYRRRTTPEEGITDTHPAYVRAIRDEVPGTTHPRRGLHRRGGPDTKSIARSPVPTQDRLRPMRGRQATRTGQRVAAGAELARAVQRGNVAAPEATVGHDASPQVRARAAATTLTWLADRLRSAA